MTTRWDPPPSGWLKCNVGFSWSKHKNLGGAAWVLKDNQGEVLTHNVELLVILMVV